MHEGIEATPDEPRSENESRQATDEFGEEQWYFDAKGSGKEKGIWRIGLRARGLVATLDDREVRLTREDIVQSRIMLLGEQGSVWIPPDWKTGLQLDYYSTMYLHKWMGDALQAWGTQEALKLARGSIPGGLFAILLWWLDGQLFLLVFGAISLLGALGRRFRPGRWLLLLLAARSAAVALVFVLDIIAERASIWWGLFVLLMLVMMQASIRKYRFFGGTFQRL